MPYKYGWLPQKIDNRDLRYSVSKPLAGLPSSVDLRPLCLQYMTRGILDHAPAHGIARAFQYAEIKAGYQI